MYSYQEHKLLPPTVDNIKNLETIRYRAYGKEYDGEIENNYYARNLISGEMLLFATFIGEELCAGCYISISQNSLFIEQLFVKPEYQNTGLRIGRNLLEYINFNKDIIAKHYNLKSIQTSRLIYSSEKSKAIYKKLGYRVTNKTLNIMTKHI